MISHAEFNTADGFKINTHIDIKLRQAPPLQIRRRIYNNVISVDIYTTNKMIDEYVRTYEYIGRHIDPITKRETFIYKELFKP